MTRSLNVWRTESSSPRACSHSVGAAHALDVGAMSVFLYCMREREDILRIQTELFDLGA